MLGPQLAVLVRRAVELLKIEASLEEVGHLCVDLEVL